MMEKGSWDFKEGWEAMNRGPRLLLRLGELTWGVSNQ